MALEEPRLRAYLLCTKILNFMTDGETPHYFINLDFDCVSNFCVSNEDHKSFDSGNAIAFASNVFNIDVVLFSGFHWGW